MFQESSKLVEFVQDDNALAALVDDLQRQPRVAVDTESNSLHAYRERVCLIQFSTPDRDYVIDALALGALQALAAIFQSEQIEKIFHAAEYDILCLRRDYGFGFRNIFDTMQAGRILGRKMAGLDRLLEEKFGVKISKRYQKANWGARPLAPELLEYAAQDTHYLIPLRDMLEADLRARGLWELAQEDFRMACTNHVAEVRAPDGPASWARLSARRDLGPLDLTILKELLGWRETQAERLDRPPFKVMSDEMLLEIARARPGNQAELAALGLSEKQLLQWGQVLVDAVARGLGMPLVRRPRPKMPSAPFLKRFEALKEWRKKTAAGLDVESDVVLPRNLLLALAENGAGALEAIMRVSPWRLQRFGPELAVVLKKVTA